MGVTAVRVKGVCVTGVGVTGVCVLRVWMVLVCVLRRCVLRVCVCVCVTTKNNIKNTQKPPLVMSVTENIF